MGLFPPQQQERRCLRCRPKFLSLRINEPANTDHPRPTFAHNSLAEVFCLFFGLFSYFSFISQHNFHFSTFWLATNRLVCYTSSGAWRALALSRLSKL